MTKLIYQSPKREKKLSQPIDETDVRRRQILEDKGWVVVERIGDEQAAPQEPAPDPQPTGDEQPPENIDDVNATKKASKLAEKLGVDLVEVEGTGEKGRITVDDVKAFAEASQEPTDDVNEDDTGEGDDE